MQYPSYQPSPRFDKITNILLLICLGLIIGAWFLFERNACELVAFIHNTGRLMSVQPDLACRIVSVTY